MTHEEKLLRVIFDEENHDEPVAELTPVKHPEMEFYLTVGRLKEVLEGLPDNAPVYYQRLEDSYFERDPSWVSVKLDESNERDQSNFGDYIRPWGAFLKKERDAVYLTAHY